MPSGQLRRCVATGPAVSGQARQGHPRQIDTALFYLTVPVRDHLKHEPTLAALLGSAAVFAVGSVLFGVFLLRTRAYPRLLCWAYIVFPALLAVLSPLPDFPLKNAIHALAGLTVCWLAVTLWRTTPARHLRPAGSPVTVRGAV